MQKYNELIEDCALAQVEWLKEQLYENTEWILDCANIHEADFNAVHSAVMQRTIELLQK